MCVMCGGDCNGHSETMVVVIDTSVTNGMALNSGIAHLLLVINGERVGVH